MFSTFYFPIISSLASKSLPKGVWETLSDGHISSSIHHIKRVADCPEHEEHAASWRQLQADLQITLGRHVDAEESYRQSQKITRGRNRDMHNASLRNTGWQALFRYRFATAMACFKRLTEEHGVERRSRLEGLFGVLCVLSQLGSLRSAAEVVETIRAELESSIEQDDSSGDWLEVVDTLRLDIAVQRTLRSSPQLDDHVYWKSEMLRESRLPAGLEKDHVERLLTQLSGIKSAILRKRVSYLDALHRLAQGRHEVIDDLTRHLDWATANGFVAYQKAVREEIALASIAGGAPHFAEAVLLPLLAENRRTPDSYQLECFYCLAKAREAQGRNRDSLQFYSRYALSAMKRLRDSSKALAYTHPVTQSAEVLDDVAARLPAKYRRGYRYILENIERSDLSVREIAVAIGVTERALQSAFKNSLGVTPRDVIRQRRMALIHSELEGTLEDCEKGVQEIAKKWGVRHRSSLVIAYRNQYNEVPSETLKR